MKRILGALVAGIVIGALISCSNPSGTPTPGIQPPIADSDADIASWFKDIYLDLLERQEKGTMGQIANCQYVCNAINNRWGKAIVPAGTSALDVATCEYLLGAVDKHVNNNLTKYGTSKYATKQIVDTIAVDRAVDVLTAKFVILGRGHFNNDMISNSSAAGTSADGITWVNGHMPVAANWTDVVYGNGVWVAYGHRRVSEANSLRSYPAVAYSYDGIFWTSASVPSIQTYFRPVESHPIHSLCFAKGIFVLTIYNIILTSTNGVNWTTRYTADSRVNVVYGQTNPFDPTTGIFVGYCSVGSFRRLYSSNGINWSTSYFNQFADGLSFDNGIFIMLSTLYAYISSDGINWTSSPFPQQQTVTYNPVYANGRWLIPFLDSPNDGYWCSIDNGATWTSIFPAIDFHPRLDLTAGNSLFMGSDAGQFRASLDGINWGPVLSGVGASSNLFFSSDYLANPLFFTVDNNRRGSIDYFDIYRSNGGNWTGYQSPIVLEDMTTTVGVIGYSNP